MHNEQFYDGKNVLITGGLGFLGSNLSLKLAGLGAKITIVDSHLPNHGANLFNIREIKDSITVLNADLRNRKEVDKVIPGQDVIFNLAGKCTHNDGDANLDVDINVQGVVNVLESCRAYNPGAKIIFPGSRLEYGEVQNGDLPINEDHPLNPIDFYGTNKATAERYHEVYHRRHGLDTTVLRITNPFGPRAQIRHSEYGVVNWFMGQVITDKEIKLFGDGSQLMDFVYIGDAVGALTMAGAKRNLKNSVFNVGSGKGVSLRDFAETAIEVAGSGRITYSPWPEGYKKTGDFFADISRINEELGWKPETSLREGLEKTIGFYRANLSNYLSPS